MILVRLVFFSNVFFITQCLHEQQSITLLKEESGDNLNFTCIGEGTFTKSALTWITSIENYKQLNRSYYLPHSKTLCDYEHNNESEWKISKWDIKNATNFSFKPITDSRWETFSTHVSSNLDVKKLAEFDQNVFSTTLSFRIKHNATIHLCDKKKYAQKSYDDCYVIFIEKTNITVSKKKDLSINGSTECNNNIVINELNENKWDNLNIKYSYKEKTKYTELKISIDMKNITCKTNRTNRIKHLLVRSNTISQWKVHNYSFLSTTKAVQNMQIGTSIHIPSNNFCISLYAALCSTCVMNIAVDGKYETYITQEIDSKKVEISDKNEKTGGTYSWKEVKVIAKINDTQNVGLFISATNRNGSDTGFWAVDDIRLCDVNEIRVANLFIDKSISDVKCQPLRGDPLSVTTPEPNIIYCADQTKIGTHCNITCESVFGKHKRNCEKNLICVRENNEENSRCHCAIGYKGPSCKHVCDRGNWGFGCNNKCHNCKNNNCNPITGTCTEGCDIGFSSFNCSYPANITNIHTIDTTVTSITLEWDSLASSNKPEFSYIVRHKHKKYKACENDTESGEWYTNISSKRRLEVKNLLPYSEYLFDVTANISDFQGNRTQFSASTNYKDNLSQEEISLNFTISVPSDTPFPLMKWTEVPCSILKGPLIYTAIFQCSDTWCDKIPLTIIRSYSNKADVHTNIYLSISGLMFYYSNYRVKVSLSRTNTLRNNNNNYIYEQAFTTRSKEPLNVNNLTVYSRNETTISLRWEAPYPPNGELEYYRVQCIGQNNCNSISFRVSRKQCELWDSYTCVDLTDLKKNTTYDIQVEAKNYGINTYGKKEILRNIITQESESEPPSNVSVTWDKDIPSLHWDHPFITNGPLINFGIEINVNKSENKEQSDFYKNVSIDKYKKQYCEKMDYLNPSAVYNIKIFPNNKVQGKPSNTKIIKMPPPTPIFLTQPYIYCFNLTCELIIAQPINKSQSSSFLYVIVDSNQTVQAETTMTTRQFLDNIGVNGNSKRKTGWLAINMTIANNTDDPITVKLGNNINSTSEYGTVTNIPLQNDTEYIVTVIIANYYLEEMRFSQRCNVPSSPKQRLANLTIQTTAISPLYALFLLLLIIPLAIIGWMLCNRRGQLSNAKQTTGVNSLWLIGCVRRNSNLGEEFPLHTTANIQAKQASDKPKYPGQTDDVTPLLKQNEIENSQFSCKVKLKNFEEYVKESIGTNKEPGELVRQHNLFVRGQTKPWDYGLKKENKFKNRYNNLIAYDHSRVKLEKINNDRFSDYINANYIDGYKKLKAYIATQGPKPTTVCDFWRMIWQECVTNIVMVANVEEDGKRKTEEYWPKLNNSVEFGSIQIYHEKSEIFSNYVFRTFTVTQNDEQRTVEQFHFTSWPDHGVPLYPQTLVPFVKKVLTVPQDSSPIVIHCSAGVGRTGTIILCDFILRMAAADGAVDFLSVLQQMREQRANLVDNENQYKLAHLVVLETLFGFETAIVCDYQLEEKIDKLINSTDIHQQIEYLEKNVWQNEVMNTSYKSTPHPANKHKSRFSTIIPDDYSRVYITRYPVNDEHSDYINAVEVDGFQIPKRFIVTQQPLPNTHSEFWRMVSEKEVTTIVSLNEIESHDESSCIFWHQEEVTKLDFFTIKHVDTDKYSTHDVIRILLIYKTEKDADEYRKNVTIVNMKGWPPLKLVPENLDSLMAVWEKTDQISRSNNPIVVTCYDGARASGVFVGLSFVIEKIKLEQICDVCLAVRIIRRNREQFIANVQQFELLYKAAVLYLKSFETYSNFPVVKTNNVN